MKTKLIQKDFNSITDLVKYCERGIVNRKIFNQQSSISGDYSFTMTHTYDEAQKLLLTGWDDGAKQLTTSLNIANAKMQNREVKRAIHDIVGFQASVPRYLQGIPTNMVNQKNVKQKQKIVTLVKSIAYSSRITANEILDDSVKFLQIVQAVEKKGIRVNVYVAWHSAEGREEVLYRTKIKSSGERLNISKMSFPLLHPSFLRRIMFKTLESDLDIQSTSWAGRYGMPQHDTQRLLKKDEYLIPVMISNKDALNIVESAK